MVILSRSVCCVRFAEAQEASDGADVEDGPGDPRREGAGEAKQGVPRLGLSILPEPRWNPGQLWEQQSSRHPTGGQQAGSNQVFGF